MLYFAIFMNSVNEKGHKDDDKSKDLASLNNANKNKAPILSPSITSPTLSSPTSKSSPQKEEKSKHLYSESAKTTDQEKRQETRDDHKNKQKSLGKI